jgi:hypothetical protein
MDTDGTVTDGETCDGWMTFNMPHTVGYTASADGGWTNSTTYPCQYLFNFSYCQQNDPD